MTCKTRRMELSETPSRSLDIYIQLDMFVKDKMRAVSAAASTGPSGIDFELAHSA